MTNHDHGIGAEPSWKSIEKILSAIVLDFLLIYSQALCYSTHIVVVNRLSAIYYYIVVLLLLLSNTALGTTCQLIGVAGLDWAELACPSWVSRNRAGPGEGPGRLAAGFIHKSSCCHYTPILPMKCYALMPMAKSSKACG